MNQEEWEKTITEHMEKYGWTKDRDDESVLGFSFIDGEAKWVRYYDKTERNFVQFNANQVVNIRISNYPIN